MTPEQFLTFADPLPEPMLLLTGNGLILGGNRAVEKRLGIAPSDLRGKSLADVVKDPPKEVTHYLRSCARSRSLVLGSVHLLAEGDGISCRAEGTLLRPHEADREAILMLRLIPKASAVGQFVALNQRIEELGKEVQRRRRAEEEARERGERLRVTLHCIGDAVITTDPEGRVAMMNSVAEGLTGWQQNEAVGLPLDTVFNIVNESSRQTVENPALRALREGMIVGLANHTVCISRDGAERPIEDSAAPIRDGRGKVVGSVLVFRDVTEQRRLAQQSRNILESITDAFCALDRDWRFTYVNRQAEVLLGRSRNDLLGKSLWEEYPDMAGTEVERHYRRVVAENVTATFEFFFPPHDRWHEVHAYPSSDGLSIYFRDVSQRRWSEVALRESEEKFRLLADTIPQLAWMARPDGHIFWYNRRWYEYTGTTPEQMEGWGWQSVHDPDTLPAVMERWQASIDTGEPFEMVFPLRGADGRFRPFLTRVNPLRDQGSRIVYWFGTNTDITDRIEIEEALRQSESQQRFLSEVSAALVGSLHYQSILRQVADLSVPTLGDFCFFDVLTDDERLERVGWKHVEPVARNLVERVRDVVLLKDDQNHPIPKAIRTGKPEFVPEVTDDWLQQIATSAAHLQFLRDLEITSLVTVPMVVGERRFGALTFCYSGSGRRHTSEEVSLAEEIARRAALTVENAKLYYALQDTDRRKDEFLATLAHELRNPLAPIRNSLQILKMPGVNAATVQQTREVMERQVHHLVRLVDDLLDVSRVMRGKIELRTEFVELTSVVARAVETAQPIVEAHGHQLTLDLPTESLLLNADPMRLAQVIGNLLTNSAKYTEANGRIWITARREREQVVLGVRDNGIGIAPEMLSRVFDLFVQADGATTRSQGGLGIGLTLVKNLVEMHHGTVKASSAGVGHGSEFVVRLPVASGQQEELAEVLEDRRPITPGSGHRLLVVDDNKDAAASLAALLSLQGHEVQVAHDGPTALALVKTYRPQMIFLDIGMPGMDGYEVARRMRQQPGLETVVLTALTGWGQEEDRRRSADAGFNHHLVKPPEPKELERLFDGLKQQA